MYVLDASVHVADARPQEPHHADARALLARMAAENRQVLLPAENKRDFADIPTEVLDKIQIIFYSDPINAAFRALGVD